MKILTLIILAICVSSCGKIDDLVHGSKTTFQLEPAQEELYSYQIIGQGCHTGEHEFETFDQVCEALRDNSLNRECAVQEREDLFFTSECSGSFI